MRQLDYAPPHRLPLFSHSRLNHSIQGHVLGRESCSRPEAQLAGPTQKRTSKSFSHARCAPRPGPGHATHASPCARPALFLIFQLPSFWKSFVGPGSHHAVAEKTVIRIIHGSFMRGVPAAVCPGGPSPEDARARCFSVIACSLTVARCPTYW